MHFLLAKVFKLNRTLLGLNHSSWMWNFEIINFIKFEFQTLKSRYQGGLFLPLGIVRRNLCPLDSGWDQFECVKQWAHREAAQGAEAVSLPIKSRATTSWPSRTVITFGGNDLLPWNNVHWAGTQWLFCHCDRRSKSFRSKVLG